MNSRIRIASELVRIARSLVGAKVNFSVDFTDDEAKLKAWCNENGYGFSSDGSSTDMTFHVTAENLDVKIRSDLIDMAVVYDIYFNGDEMEIEQVPSIENVIKAISGEINRTSESMVENFQQECANRLRGLCSDAYFEKYAYDNPFIVGTLDKNPGIQFLFGYDNGKWGCEFDSIDGNGIYKDTIISDFSYDTPEEAVDALARHAARQSR